MTRRLRLSVVTVVLIFAIGAVAIGFRTGWLATHDGGREVGRLRPADLIVNVDGNSAGDGSRAANPSSTTIPTTISDGMNPHTPNGPGPSGTSPLPFTAPSSTDEHHVGGLADDD